MCIRDRCYICWTNRCRKNHRWLTTALHSCSATVCSVNGDALSGRFVVTGSDQSDSGWSQTDNRCHCAGSVNLTGPACECRYPPSGRQMPRHRDLHDRWLTVSWLCRQYPTNSRPHHRWIPLLTVQLWAVMALMHYFNTLPLLVTTKPSTTP